MKFMEDEAKYDVKSIESLKSLSMKYGNPKEVKTKKCVLKKKNKVNWEEGQDSLPEGWKLGTKLDGKKIFLCPDGSIHQDRRRALRYMIAKSF